MDLKWIDDFLALSQHGSFAKAANACNITQPAFGRRIKNLEEWIGVPLVNRNTYPTTFTQAGFRFIKYAHELKKQIEYVRIETAKMNRQDETFIKVHAPHALSEYLVNRIINTNPITFEDARIFVQPNNLHDSVQEFIKNEDDFLLGLSFKHTPLYVPNPDVESVTIGSEYLIPVTAMNNQGIPLFKDGVDQVVPLLNYPSDAFFAQVMRKHDALTYCQCQFKIVYENSITHSLKSMALSGYGVAWLPAGFVLNELIEKKLTLFTTNSPAIPAKIKLFKFSNNEMSPITDQLWRSFNELSLDIKEELCHLGYPLPQ
ncbi:LysR family transcriptional regulator [Vibrio campbellii]|uniref:LysR family transcriptional regulator n=1 Tax=Vibrio campbellii TaxID=680 RepID=UPI0009C0B369|nr:LysR family transcriptional regulator [Vibrio campbellii]OQQ03458.1 LysR family transcriptional regulator [Vibrio campbellii]